MRSFLFQFACFYALRLLLSLFRIGSSKPSPTVSDDFIIGLEDALSIMSGKNPNYRLRCHGSPRWKISMPLVGDIQASGFNAQQLQDRIFRSG